MNKIIPTLFIAAATSVATVAPADARSCKDYSSCREAVRAWINGQHPRADRDNDGIPCENVCRSRRQVKRIIKQLRKDK